MMSFISTPRRLSDLRLRIWLDAICWIGATLFLGLYLEWTTTAAIVGASGILYLKAAIGIYRSAKAKVAKAVRELAQQYVDDNND